MGIPDVAGLHEVHGHISHPAIPWERGVGGYLKKKKEVKDDSLVSCWTAALGRLWDMLEIQVETWDRRPRLEKLAGSNEGMDGNWERRPGLENGQ